MDSKTTSALGVAMVPEKIYSWNIWRWRHWWEKTPLYKKPIQLEKTDQIIGGQMFPGAGGLS